LIFIFERICIESVQNIFPTFPVKWRR